MPSTSTGAMMSTGTCMSWTASACVPHPPTTRWTPSTRSSRNSEAGLWRVASMARPAATGGVGQLRAACLRGLRRWHVHQSPTSGFAAYATEGIDLCGKITAGVSGIGSPSWNRHQARLDQLEPVEEAGDLLGAAEVVGERSTFVVALLSLRKCSADDVGSVVERQVTTGG